MKTDFKVCVFRTHFKLQEPELTTCSFQTFWGRYSAEATCSLLPMATPYYLLLAIVSASSTLPSMSPDLPSSVKNLLKNQRSSSYTLPLSHRRNISQLALSPDGSLLLSIDEDGRAILSHLPQRLVLYHFSFKAPVSALAFSPSGRYFAAGVGRFVEVWYAPSTPSANSDEGLEFAPFVRHRVHAGHHDVVQGIEWSSDSRFFLSSSKDLTARLWSLEPPSDFVPTTLGGHREALIGAWFSVDQELVSKHQSYNSPSHSRLDVHRKSGRRFVSVALRATIRTTSARG